MTDSAPSPPVPVPDLVPPGPDRARTVAHLSDTVLTALGHATRHIAVAQAGGSPDAVKFNVEHTAHHITEAHEHQQKLISALIQYHPEVGDELGKLREVTQPEPAPGRSAAADADYDVTPPDRGPQPA